MASPLTDSPPSSPADPSPDASGSDAYGTRQRVGLWLGPAVLLLFLLLPAPEGLALAGWRAAGVGLLMAVWWVTEAIPIAATSLLPLVLFPVLGVVPIGDAAPPYANPLIFLFMGGFMIAIAMERWNLHRRLALRVIYTIGTRPERIVGGFILSSAFLSMWISNTATAMMMLPIGLSVIELVRRHEEKGGNFAVALMLAIAYASSIGGLGTLIGTPTNVLLAGFVQEAYDLDLSFVNWMKVGLPLVLIGLVVVYVILTRVAFPIRIREIPGGKAFIRDELRALGTMSRGEVLVAIVFGMTAVLWISRQGLQAFIPGLSDAGIAVFGALVLFLLPVDLKRGVFVLDWASAKKLPWGVLLLFGGGLSLAGAVQNTGLATWIGTAMSGLSAWPILLLTLLVVTVIVLLTELTSNTATAAAFLPVLASIAIGIGQNPLLLLVPATLAASCAFMLPVATPPNAIVYGGSFVSIPQMVRAGSILNLLFVVLVTALVYTLVPWALGIEIGVLPDWAVD